MALLVLLPSFKKNGRHKRQRIKGRTLGPGEESSRDDPIVAVLVGICA